MRSRQAVEPVQGFVDVFVLESGGVQLARQRLVVGAAVGLVEVFEEIYENVEHVLRLSYSHETR